MPVTDCDHDDPSCESHPRLCAALILLCAIIFGTVLVLPAFQGIDSRGPTRAFRNLRQIGIALDNYCFKNGSLPYDPKGPEHALYVLADVLPASCFDSDPHHAPRPEAKWDHDERRLVGSDFEYLNLPDIELRDIDGRLGHMIVVAEKPSKSYQAISLLRCDGFITYCRTPDDSSRDLLGNWENWDGCLFKDDQLLHEWNSVPLPRTTRGSYATSDAAGSIGSIRIVRYTFGRINVYYEYLRDELFGRTFESPEGEIKETVTTDSFGRIIGFTREPQQWRRSGPSNAKVNDRSAGEQSLPALTADRCSRAGLRDRTSCGSA